MTRLVTQRTALGLLAGIGLLILALLALRIVRSVNTASARVLQSQEVRFGLEELVTALGEAESGGRGFVITGDERFLATFDGCIASAQRRRRELRHLLADNPHQRARLDGLGPLVDQKVDEMRRVVGLRRTEGMSAAAAQTSGARGRLLMEQIRAGVNAMRAAENELLTDRLAAARRTARGAFFLFGIGLLLLAALGATVFHLFRREMRTREAAASVAAEARAYAESIVDTVPEPLVILTGDLAINSANRAFYEMFHTTPAQVVGRPLTAASAEAWAMPDVLDALRRVASGPAPLEHYEIRRDFGALGRKTLRLNARALHAPGSASARILLAIEDITARQAAEEERERFFTVALDLLCVAEFSGRFRRVNPAFTAVLGWTQEEMQARPFIEFVHPDDREATLAEVQRQSGGGTVMNFENRYQCKDGSWRWLAWKSVPVPEAGLMYATARDVTDRRQAVEEIARLNSDLRRRAAELEVANRELEAFSYSVSHDLRAPVRHIGGFAAMLGRHAGSTFDDEARRYLATISDSATRMGQLIDDLLLFSRISRAELNRRPVDLTSLARDVRQRLETEARGRVIHWQIDPLPVVIGDASLLRQVLENLLSNAVKYTRGRPEARIHIGPAASPAAGEVAVCVRDNGTGFDMRYAHKLFVVFSRLHRDDEFEGTGVGLANVQRIVQRHGGRCWAESRPPEPGAAFYFSLPAT